MIAKVIFKAGTLHPRNGTYVDMYITKPGFMLPRLDEFVSLKADDDSSLAGYVHKVSHDYTNLDGATVTLTLRESE